MLIQFTVENFLSFKDYTDQTTFSMLASDSADKPDNMFEINNQNLLKTSVIYGASGSGKSNLLKAISFAKRFIINSSKNGQAKQKIDVNSYRLAENKADQPSHFEFIFIQSNIKYCYGFRATKNEIVSEWLLRLEKEEKITLFEREYQDIKVYDDFEEGKDLESRTRSNALFLSVVAQFNGETAASIIEWFMNLRLEFEIESNWFHGFWKKIKYDLTFKNKVLKYLAFADIEIKDLIVQNTMAHAVRIGKDGKGKDIPVLFNIREESKGIQKYLNLLDPIIDTLEEGSVLFVDDLDIRLHPVLLEGLISLLHDPEHNKNNAQFIFTSNNTSLLDRDVFRRDQIWFTDRYNQQPFINGTSLVSLDDFEERKGDINIEKSYLAGRYGAVPVVNDLEFLI